MKKMLIAILIFNLGCSHQSQKQFQSHLHGFKCEEAMQSIPELKRSEKAKKSATWMAKSTAAYTYVGANYTAEVLWDVSVGTLMVVALCWPAVLAAASGSGTSIGCIPSPVPFQALSSPSLGRNAIQKTQEMRCPNVEPLALSLEKVAHCFESRNTQQDRKLAYKTLSNIENSKYFFSCVSPEVSQRISAQRVALEKDEQLNN
jgi:hypothetical protein